MKKIMFNNTYGLTQAVKQGTKTMTHRVLNLSEEDEAWLDHTFVLDERGLRGINAYTDKAREVFLDNLRLASRLHSCGMPKDEEYRAAYEQYCKEQSAFGITYCAMARCYYKMKKHEKLMANIEKYNPIAKKLLYSNRFFNGDPILITKDILINNVDELDTYELGLNEGKLLMEYGPGFR